MPLHTLRVLPLLAAEAEALLLDALRGYWRRRGCVLPLLVERGMLLDTAALFRLVAMRGGFWGACAAQVRPADQESAACMHRVAAST